MSEYGLSANVTIYKPRHNGADVTSVWTPRDDGAGFAKPSWRGYLAIIMIAKLTYPSPVMGSEALRRTLGGDISRSQPLTISKIDSPIDPCQGRSADCAAMTGLEEESLRMEGS